MVKIFPGGAALSGAVLFTAFTSCIAIAAPPDGDGARFSMAPVDGGFVRLDKQTGAMSICKPNGGDWSCKAMGSDEDGDRDELDRLKAENADLKEEIRRMEEVFGLDGKKAEDGEKRGPLAGPPGGPLPEFKLPSEQDVDKAVDYLEGMIRKFRERFEDFGDKTDPDRPREKGGEAEPKAEPQAGPRTTTPL